MTDSTENSATPSVAEPDALAPQALNHELTNFLFASAGGKLTRQKAEDVVAGLLAIQMRYYAQIATPEVTDNAAQVNNAVNQLTHATGALINAGAAMTGTAFPHDVKNWQAAAARMRDAGKAVIELLS